VLTDLDLADGFQLLLEVLAQGAQFLYAQSLIRQLKSNFLTGLNQAFCLIILVILLLNSIWYTGMF
jgi:hypothetical protein